MNKISWGYDVDGSLWTEVCGRKFVDESCGQGGDSNIKKVGVLANWSPLGVNFKILDEHPYLFYISLWTEVVDRRRKLWTVDGNDFRSSLLDRDRPYGAQNEK